MGFCTNWFLVILALIISVYVLQKSHQELCFKLEESEQSKYLFNNSIYEILFLLTVATGIITFCSTSSVFYPINAWVDPNCFFTTGKSMVHGKVLYRDIYEQKGPLLHMLHAVSYLISSRSFLGVWILEIIACWGFLYFSYRTLRLYCSCNSLLLIPFLALLIYTQISFVLGDSVEELCLPLFAYALFISAKNSHDKTIPNKYECFWIGVTSACVWWMKFSLVGFYIGWFIVPAVILLISKRYKDLLKIISFITIGVITISIPILVYFIKNHALTDLFKVYFYDNIFVYTNVSSWSTNLTAGRISFAQNSRFALSLLLLGLAWTLVIHDFYLFFNILSTSILAFIFIYIGGRRYTYYSFGLSVFSTIGIMPLNFVIKDLHNRKKTIAIISVLICILVSGYITPHKDQLFKPKKDNVQFQFANLINTKENATLLNYKFLDGGFYTASGIVPNMKYFCRENLPLKEMWDAQENYIKEGKTDFIVTRNNKLNSKNYVGIATEGNYRLYERKDLLEKGYHVQLAHNFLIANENKLLKYLELINQERYSVFISVKDEATKSLNDDLINSFKKLGFTFNLKEKYRYSYLAIKHMGKVTESLDKKILESNGNINDNCTYSVISAGYDCGNKSSIIINGHEYSKNKRGINIVIYDNDLNKIIDQVCFDTFDKSWRAIR